MWLSPHRGTNNWLQAMIYVYPPLLPAPIYLIDSIIMHGCIRACVHSNHQCTQPISFFLDYPRGYCCCYRAGIVIWNNSFQQTKSLFHCTPVHTAQTIASLPARLYQLFSPPHNLYLSVLMMTMVLIFFSDYDLCCDDFFLRLLLFYPSSLLCWLPSDTTPTVHA